MKIKSKFVVALLIFILFPQALFVFGEDEKIISLKFRDAEIKTVLEAIAQKAIREGKPVNIVASQEVGGLINVDLHDVDWQTALNTILKPYDYGYEWAGTNVILVDTIENIGQRAQRRRESKVDEFLDTRVFILKFASAEELSKILRNMLTPNVGKITYDTRTNSLVVSDSNANLNLLFETINSLDKPMPQIQIEAKVLDTSFDLTNRLGINWNLSVTASGSKRSTSWPFTRTSENKWLRDEPMPPVEDLVTDSNPLTNYFNYGTLDASRTSATLEIIFNDANTKVVSMPSIATLNNSTAKIDVVTLDPVPRYTYNKETGNWEINGFEDKECGVTLEVTPQLNKDGYITLLIQPKVSELVREKEFASSSGLQATVPVISKQTTSTKVMIKDGETLVIAGLVRDRISDSVNKIPVLGDIPVLGYAFKHRAKTKEKRNLLIFITPKVVASEVAKNK